MNFEKIKLLLDNNGHPKYRFTQLLKCLNTGTDNWDDCTLWPAELRRECQQAYSFTSWVEGNTSISKDGTVKALLQLKDGSKIETVLMEPKPGHGSICLSCEVGCTMNCAFCATGKMGFTRQLTYEEITDQVLFWNHYLLSPTTSAQRQISNHLPADATHQALQADQSSTTIKSIVFMGMGEPFHNTENVLTAIKWLNTYFDYGSRHISVSTCGIPEGIIQLGNSFPQVNLAISLHSAIANKRSSLMPVNRQYSLTQIKVALLSYLRLTNRQIMFEYLLIDKVNDGIEDQRQLVTFLSAFPKHLIHLNLIRYNQNADGFTPTEVKQVIQWKRQLIQQGVSVSIRKNLGTDIHGACGQLAGTIS